MVTDTIYCYYAELGWPREKELVAYWKERWQKEGWKAVVLGDDDAHKDARWAAMQTKISSFPRLPGHREFGAVNFRRWLAFSHITGAVADYDVFPLRPFPPKDFGGFYNGDGDGGPGFICGSPADFGRVVDLILSYKEEPDDVYEGTRHVCDMRILQKNKAKLFDKIEIIHCCYVPGFEKYPLCHFGNHYLAEMTQSYRKMSKVHAVKMLVEKHYHESA